MPKLPCSQPATAIVLTHPAFNRPRVINPHRRGRRGENVFPLWKPSVREAVRRVRNIQEIDAVARCAFAWRVSFEQAREQIAARVAFARLSGRRVDFHEAALCLADREARHV
ncbi:hypothetical protein BLA18112_03854 [Burkholderia lata]|uniref:Uncharacterized protein n=1 Tax=Burkholderia lata (strain ATCC 17760 / DSM 23089 / LMG 22485 / NCIMB 9086 / R18194 / 383) TaxID=482957 RepID=A0A6P2WQC9_BURL3|nr:hypothetical protein [Burkholderia lata]VWC98976.1 hypothetical protein BLA18112_03854 [Burkholderia lata]